MDVTKLSALALIPDGAVWPAIQEFRVAYDREVDKWPPHINLFYPFVPEADFEVAAQGLVSALAELGSVKIRFCSMGNFGGIVYLKPRCDEDPGLARLYAACKAAFPGIPERHLTFQPHLTMARFKNVKQAEAFIAQSAPIDFETEISCLSFLARDSMKHPFRTPCRVDLCGRGVCMDHKFSQPYMCRTPWAWTFKCLPQCAAEAADGIGELTRSVSGKLVRSLSGTSSRICSALDTAPLCASSSSEADGLKNKSDICRAEPIGRRRSRWAKKMQST